MRISILIILLFITCMPKIHAYKNNAVAVDTPTVAMDFGFNMLLVGYDSTLQEKIVSFAKKQIGAPYRYCSMTPNGGFDCSGFVNYVFNHFNIWVPRSSVGFTNMGKEIPLNKAQPGDLILFTGTNPHKHIVGHIGIITTNTNGEINFIQSTSGIAYGVVISLLDKNYMRRFVKIIRIFE